MPHLHGECTRANHSLKIELLKTELANQASADNKNKLADMEIRPQNCSRCFCPVLGKGQIGFLFFCFYLRELLNSILKFLGF